MKSEDFTNKFFTKKKNQELGRVEPQPFIDLNNSKYKQPVEIIFSQFERSQLPEKELYAIDKIVRSRGKCGRFGVDHSELLNYELDETNKERDQHMNWLVYKDENNLS